MRKSVETAHLKIKYAFILLPESTSLFCQLTSTPSIGMNGSRLTNKCYTDRKSTIFYL